LAKQNAQKNKRKWLFLLLVELNKEGISGVKIMILNIADNAEKTTEQLKESLEQKIQQAEGKLESISKKIKQSQVEVDKLAQRQVANTAKIRNIKENAEDLSPIAVRDAYEEALDAQQRLFVMRGQMEKFKNEQVHLQDFILQMQDISGFLTKTPLLEGGEVELNAAEVIESVIQAQEAERHKFMDLRFRVYVHLLSPLCLAFMCCSNPIAFTCLPQVGQPTFVSPKSLMSLKGFPWIGVVF